MVRKPVTIRNSMDMENPGGTGGALTAFGLR